MPCVPHETPRSKRSSRGVAGCSVGSSCPKRGKQAEVAHLCRQFWTPESVENKRVSHRRAYHMRWNHHKRRTTGRDDIHTPVNPYCLTLTCWCHTDTRYHARVTRPAPTRQEVRHAAAFFGQSRPGAGREYPLPGNASGHPAPGKARVETRVSRKYRLPETDVQGTMSTRPRQRRETSHEGRHA